MALYMHVIGTWTLTKEKTGVTAAVLHYVYRYNIILVSAFGVVCVGTHADT